MKIGDVTATLETAKFHLKKKAFFFQLLVRPRNIP